MKLVLGQKASFVLNAMVRQPEQLPLGGVQGVSVYKAEDMKGARNLRRLQNWIEEHVLEGENLDFPKEAKTVGIKQSYSEVLYEIIRHYEKIGFLGMVRFSEGYMELRQQFESKDSMIDDDDAFEDSGNSLNAVSTPRDQVREALASPSAKDNGQ